MELALHCIALTSYRYGHVFENAKLIFSSLLPPPKNIYKNKLHNCNSIWMLKNISLKHTGDLKVILAPVQFKTWFSPTSHYYLQCCFLQGFTKMEKV